jgi:hypothetical protein
MYESARRQQANVSVTRKCDTQNGLNECLASDTTESDGGKARSTEEVCLRTQHTLPHADCCQQCDVGPCFEDCRTVFLIL